MFLSARDAKQFFVDKVIAQANAESRPLSELQRWMLQYSEDDPEFEADHEKMQAFEQEISDAEYEEQVTGLLRRRYRQDLRDDPRAASTYREAYQLLRRGDHYLLLMIERALGGRLRHPFSPVNIGIGILCLVPAFVAATMAAGILLFGLAAAESPLDILISLAPSLLLAGMAYYLIHLWRR